MILPRFLSHWSSDFLDRAEEAELMDLPEADIEALYATVRQFRLINPLFTRSRYLIGRYIIEDALRRGLGTVRVADLGAGGGDIAVWLLKEGERRGLSVTVICLDHDPRLVAYAKRELAALPSLEYHCAGAEELERFAPVDYVFANHFLHHLSGAELPRMIRIVNNVSRYGFVLNDLRRSRLSYAGFTLFAALFLRRSFAYNDGRLSIRKGFLPEELNQYAREAGVADHQLLELFPGRLALIAHRR
ncbi:MAG: methyltransferase domain-containing protein [Alkalispirochaetaceae bacterium]